MEITYVILLPYYCCSLKVSLQYTEIHSLILSTATTMHHKTGVLLLLLGLKRFLFRATPVSLPPSQGVISLEPLGKKGYSIPKAGTIQVVSLSSLIKFFKKKHKIVK